MAPRPDGLSPSCRSVLTNWRPSSPKSLTDPWSCSTINPVSNKSTITGLCDYRPVALMSQAHHRALGGPLQFAYRANGLASDAINMGQHHNMHPRPNQNQGRMPGSCSWTSTQLSRPSSQASWSQSVDHLLSDRTGSRWLSCPIRAVTWRTEKSDLLSSLNHRQRPNCMSHFRWCLRSFTGSIQQNSLDTSKLAQMLILVAFSRNKFLWPCIGLYYLWQKCLDACSIL